MSLINDALKRAQQSSSRPAGAAADPPLQPAVALPAPRAQRRAWLIPAGALAMLLMATWVFGGRNRSVHSGPGPSPTASPRQTLSTTAASAAVPAKGPAISAAPQPQPQSAPEPEMSAPLKQRPVPEAVVTSAPPPAIAPNAPAPTLELQAIHYRLSKPSVRINGKTVLVGEAIDGARVVSIQRQSVQLLVAGKTTALTLP